MDQTVHHSHTPHLDKITNSRKEITSVGQMNYPEPSTEKYFEKEISVLRESIIAPDPALVEKLINTIVARHEEPI